MYSVVVVDDEHYDLEGLINFIPWSKLQMEIAGSFHDAFSALEYMKQKKVDILVTDIHMPIMSGLQLAEQAMQLHSNLKLVFVTGHEDFQFAKRALQMQACSYVLKPVDDDELTSVLEKVAVQLSQEQQQQLEWQYIRNSMLYVKHELLRRCLLGVYDEQASAALILQYRLFANREQYYVAVIEVDDTRWKLLHDQEAMRKQTLEQIYQCFVRLCEQASIELYCQLQPHRFALLLTECKKQLIEQELFQAWLSKAEQQLGCTFTIGLGLAVGHVNELNISFHQALRALSAKMVYGKCKMIVYEPQATYCMEKTRKIHDVEAVIKELYLAILSYRLVDIVDCMEQLFEHAAALQNEASVYQFVLYCISKIEGYMYEDNIDLYKLLEIDRGKWSIIMRFETVGDIHRWFRRTFLQLSEMIHMRKCSESSRLVKEIQQYISDRLQQPLTLKTVAQQFAFSPNYLGHLFKQETGLTFNEYITKKRMEKAKRLLQDPTRKVYEVANAIGYKDLTYFSKQFKEFTGMTAGDFRKRC